jgi:ribosome-associated translation inhibitor RaiA/cold shock CspA family protein
MQRPLQVTYKGLEKSEAIDGLIRGRAAALEALHPRITGCRVVVEVPHRGSENAKVPIAITVEVEVPGRALIVGKDAEERREAKQDHTAALNNAFDAVERQLERTSDRQADEVARTTAPQTGMVVRLFPEQNHGFVELDNSPELYFTRNAVTGGSFDELAVGMLVHVTRANEEGPMGPQAKSIRLLDRGQAPS